MNLYRSSAQCYCLSNDHLLELEAYTGVHHWGRGEIGGA